MAGALTRHDCNDYMVELDDGFGWDCSVCWNRGGTEMTIGLGKALLFFLLLPGLLLGLGVALLFRWLVSL